MESKPHKIMVNFAIKIQTSSEPTKKKHKKKKAWMLRQNYSDPHEAEKNEEEKNAKILS